MLNIISLTLKALPIGATFKNSYLYHKKNVPFFGEKKEGIKLKGNEM